ncbi:hypothetical protein BSA16_06360, partial [Micromonospora sp. Rc5]
ERANEATYRVRAFRSAAAALAALPAAELAERARSGRLTELAGCPRPPAAPTPASRACAPGLRPALGLAALMSLSVMAAAIVGAVERASLRVAVGLPGMTTRLPFALHPSAQHLAGLLRCGVGGAGRVDVWSPYVRCCVCGCRAKG